MSLMLPRRVGRLSGLNGGRWCAVGVAACLLSLVSVGAADAAVGPSVSTGAATSVTATSVTFNGT
jgi:hypothetical protein